MRRRWHSSAVVMPLARCGAPHTQRSAAHARACPSSSRGRQLPHARTTRPDLCLMTPCSEVLSSGLSSGLRCCSLPPHHTAPCWQPASSSTQASSGHRAVDAATAAHMQLHMLLQAHGACPNGAGKPPKEDPKNPWVGTCGEQCLPSGTPAVQPFWYPACFGVLVALRCGWAEGQSQHARACQASCSPAVCNGTQSAHALPMACHRTQRLMLLLLQAPGS